jgi:aquaporin Z
MKKYFAELIGTFALVLFGCGAAVVAGNNIPAAVLNDPPTAIGLGLLGISLAFGLAVVVMAYAIGPISGCHINPAITISMLVAGKISSKDAVGYIIAQFVGATIGAAILYLFIKGHTGFAGLGEFALGSNGYGEGYLGQYDMVSAFAAEAIMTFMFLFVIFAVTSRMGNSNMAGLAIGLALVLIHMVVIPITGTSVNPARSFGPAVFAGGKALQQLWLFMVAPVIGGIAAALLWKGVFEPAEA